MIKQEMAERGFLWGTSPPDPLGFIAWGQDRK